MSLPDVRVDSPAVANSEFADMPGAADDFWVLGRFSGVFGIKGWLKVHSHTDPRESILDYDNWHVAGDNGWFGVKVAEGRRQGKQVLVRLEATQDREGAEGWVGKNIGVRRAELPDAGEGHYYWSDLEGLTVVNVRGKTLGVVDHLLATGANDVLVVKGEKEILIPFIDGHFVKQVDFDTREIHVDWDWADED